MARYAKFFSVGGGGSASTSIIVEGTGLLSTIRCGVGNTATCNYSVSLGGQYNTASGYYNFIGSGFCNTTNCFGAIVTGGSQNISNSNYGTISGGFGNTVSSCYAAISGGQSNTARGSWSSIGGGQANCICTGALWAKISGGKCNLVTVDNTFIGGGEQNKAYAYNGVVAGGVLNRNCALSSGILSGNSNLIGNVAQHSAIAGGVQNTITGQSSFIGSGVYNTASASYSTVGGGLSNRAVATYSSILGGSANCAAASYSTISGGYKACAYLYGQESYASGVFAIQGDAQRANLVARRTASLSSGGSAKLSLDGTGTTNLIIPDGNNRVWGVEINAVVVATIAGGTVALGDSLQGKYVLLFKRIGGVSSVVGINTSNLTYDASLSTANFAFTAGASGDLAITFNAPTTATSTTFRIVAEISLSEVAY